MKPLFFALAILVVCCSSRAGNLPVFTTQPTNQNVLPGNAATFSVAATGATSFQWRFNGIDISGATNSTLQVTNVQTTNSGYYVAIAQNATGWAPSGLAYLSIGSYGPIYLGGGYVPLSNLGGAVADYQDGYGGGELITPITDGMAQVVAGPQLDQMQPVGYATPVSDGYFDDADQMVPTVLPGQTIYYKIAITYPYESGTYTQPSRILKLVAGGGSYPTPDVSNLKFPAYIEWPDPDLSSETYFDYSQTLFTTSPTPTCMPGETVSFTNIFYANGDYGVPTGQWRKDGNLLPNGTNWVQVDGNYPGYGDFAAILTLTNVQPSDAGVYDVQVLGNNWLIAGAKTFSIQVTNGQGVFLSPRSDSSNFLTDLQGMAGRNYAIQRSSNLVNWNALLTITNTTGLATLTNAFGTNNVEFYRAMLLP